MGSSPHLQHVMHSSFLYSGLTDITGAGAGGGHHELMSFSIPSVGWNLKNSTDSTTLSQARYPPEGMPILKALQSKWDSTLYKYVVLTKIAFNSWLISIISFLSRDEKKRG